MTTGYPGSGLTEFWTRVDATAGLFDCWPWQLSLNPAGYGKVRVNGRMIGAHRLAWLLAVGPVPAGLMVRHRCDNPPCVNPSHLELGTHQQNMDDRKRRRPELYSGERNKGARLTAVQVQEVRRRYEAGGITQRRLASEYGVALATIWRVVVRENWQTVR